ncbi:MAG TPA: OmpA family protein [Rhizomicrobium sp.]|nr:OmpA family protein [Rhizomicrobium sp.]
MASALVLGACATSAVDDLDGVTATGSPFTQALFRNYSYLARSFGDVGAPSSSAFDSDNSLSFSDSDASVDDLADAFARKALQAAQGANVMPEPAPDAGAQDILARLLHALDLGRDKAPDDAARAQADYDCWVMDGRVHGQEAASAACRASLNGSLAQLEHDVNPPAPMMAPVAADYTVYFDFDSWTLTAEALQVITQAVNNARAGGQSHINLVGHTDTSGSPAYNQSLSLRRANVVKDVMVQMGARAEAITTTGVGESDLAVQTADGVREPKNRRTVITLQP